MVQQMEREAQEHGGGSGKMAGQMVRHGQGGWRDGAGKMGREGGEGRAVRWGGWGQGDGEGRAEKIGWKEGREKIVPFFSTASQYCP